MGAGLPVISTLRTLVQTGDRILRIEVCVPLPRPVTDAFCPSTRPLPTHEAQGVCALPALAHATTAATPLYTVGSLEATVGRTAIEFGLAVFSACHSFQGSSCPFITYFAAS